MIDFRKITESLEDILNAANTSAEPYTITRNQRINQSESVAVDGWVGIYRDHVSFDPRTTGPRPWMAEPKIRIEVQAASFANEEDCERRLDMLQNFVLSAINADKTIGGYVAMITEIDIDYDDSYATDIQTHHQFATIIITCEVKA